MAVLELQEGEEAADSVGPRSEPGCADLVIKFGGTSLGTARRIRHAALRVAAHVRRGRQPVVVVSATGHTTDRILDRVARVAPGGAADPREVDRAMATGEDLSAALLALALQALGVDARSLRGVEAGVEVEGAFGAGRIRRVHAAGLQRLVERGVVPVVSGFQGGRVDGETLTLGRGGSDTSAVALAGALGAECHIVTDVPAVYDRDPRRHPDAVPYGEMSHAALVALTTGGAQVVHPRAATLAGQLEVPLRVYHFRAPLSGRGGTRVGRPRHELDRLGGAA